MNRNDRIAKIIEAIKNSANGNLSLHVIVSEVFDDYAPAVAVTSALNTVRAAEKAGLIRLTTVQMVGTFHEVYEAA